LYFSNQKSYFFGRADGLSPVVRGGRKTGPAGLRWLLKSPPRLAGQTSATLRATRLNPSRSHLQRQPKKTIARSSFYPIKKYLKKSKFHLTEKGQGRKFDFH
jgi:hypothetical protein